MSEPGDGPIAPHKEFISAGAAAKKRCWVDRKLLLLEKSSRERLSLALGVPGISLRLYVQLAHEPNLAPVQPVCFGLVATKTSHAAFFYVVRRERSETVSYGFHTGRVPEQTEKHGHTGKYWQKTLATKRGPNQNSYPIHIVAQGFVLRSPL